MPIIPSKEIVLSQKSERNEAEQDENRYKNLLHNMALPISRLPSEILVAIINLSLPGPPTEFVPYPCFIFSWVCHHWRLIVLDNPMFWNRIGFHYRSLKDITHPMVKEALLRSHTLPLDLAVYSPVSLFHELQGPDANRVRTLRLGPRVYDSQYPPLSHFTSLFPSLTTLFLKDYYQKIDLSNEPLPRFQALEAAVKNLGNLALPNNFSNLWWLHLRYGINFPLVPLLVALQNLPRLRVLSLYPLGARWKLPDLPKNLTLTFHDLEALSTGSPILQLMTAPKLLYLQCTQYPRFFFWSQENFNHFCGFDFSNITHIRCVMNYGGPKFYIMGKFKTGTLDDGDTTPLMIKNDRRSPTGFDEISTSYPNEFYIQVDLYSAVPRLLLLFATIVKKANNLNEIILNYLNPSEWPNQTDEEKNLLLDALRSAKTVRTLTVSGNEFVTFCGYLQDGTLCPNLERLAYSIQDPEEQDFLDPLLELVTERRKICPQPLEVELTGFSAVPSEALEPAEKLGLRLIQKPRDPSQLISEFLEDV
ncbi:hypothetical protein Clacol_000167 [Clathrus columnatus]|uniref:F-box domain-containing protein n=1 Tax=Clathrus columnatus TaxID=1419009 RepID=A0AAV5A262_9AGAM|nr:hypothetical protein Clacol_000167 [Clathrus columnatus]